MEDFSSYESQLRRARKRHPQYKGSNVPLGRMMYSTNQRKVIRKLMKRHNMSFNELASRAGYSQATELVDLITAEVADVIKYWESRER